MDSCVRGPPGGVAALRSGPRIRLESAEHLLGNAYLLAALAFSVWAAVALNRQGAQPLLQIARSDGRSDAGVEVSLNSRTEASPPL